MENCAGLTPAVEIANPVNQNASSLDSRAGVGAVDIPPHLRLPAVLPRDVAPQYFIPQPIGNRYILSRRKRTLDVVVAFLALLVAMPLLLLLALAVKASSGGPAIFRQARNGLNCRSFSILKFRTMYHWPEEHGDGFLKQASRGDHRVTGLGYWLRRLSLDELPQIINVLRGDMSLVGPRPHALSHDIYYAVHIAHYYNRYLCRPGVTGLAQVSGARGETASHDDMQRRVDCDLRYIETASLLGDISLIAKTVVKLIDNRGVY